jgi:hypothetical protein
MSHHLQTIILTARPAAGKSEVIDYLKKVSDADRLRRFHLGPFEEFDDFPALWEKFEEDDIFEHHGRPRLYTDEKKYFLDDFFWTFMIEKINLAFRKRLAREPGWLEHGSAIIEFARGGEDGIGDALRTLHDDVLSRAGILYIDVSYEESVRKNRRRFRPDQADSILFHSLPDEKMEHYYRTNDWAKLSGGKREGAVQVGERRVPFAVLPNEPEVTDDPNKLGPALEDAFARLRGQFEALGRHG